MPSAYFNLCFDRHPNASSYDGRRGIGKPKGIPRIHRDSTGNVFHRPEMEDEGNEQTGEDYEDKGDGYDQFEYDDVDIDNGLEMESNSNDDGTTIPQICSNHYLHAILLHYRISPPSRRPGERLAFPLTRALLGM